MNIKTLLGRAARAAVGSLLLFTSVSHAQVGQQYIYLSDGSGNILTLSGHGSGGGTITFPTGGGMLLTSVGGNSTLGTVTSGTWQGTAIAPGYGGTGLTSYAIGDLLVATGTTTLASLADVASGSVLLSGGVGAAPTYGQLPIADIDATGTPSSSNFLRGDGTWSVVTSGFTNPMNKLGDMIYGGTGGAATDLVGQTTIPTAFLIQTESGNTAAAPAWFDLFGGTNTWSGTQTFATSDAQGSAINASINSATSTKINGSEISGNISGEAAGLSATLAVGSGGTGLTSYAIGDLLVATGTTTLASLPDVASGSVLLSGGIGMSPTYGQLPIADIDATGTPSSSNFLRGDGTWSVVTSGFTNPMNKLGDMIYGGTGGAATDLVGQTTIPTAFLIQTESGNVSAAPAWFDLFGGTNTWSGTQTFATSDAQGSAINASINSATSTKINGSEISGNISGEAAGLSATLAVGSGGTGLTSYAIGDLLVATGTTTLASLPDVASGSVLLSGGVGMSPTYGLLPVADISTSSGTPSSTTYLRGDGTWATFTSGTVTSVGIGTLSNGISGTVSNGTSNATINLGLGDITPTSVTTEPATDEVSTKVEQSTAVSPTADIFDVTSSGGGTKYISVNNAGQTTISGTIQGSVSGSAATVPASGLTGTTLASNVTGSSLTSVAALTSGSLGTGFTTVGVAQGGTGDATLTAYAPIVGGTGSTAALQQVSNVGALTGMVLTYQGASSLPTWVAAATGTVTSVGIGTLSNGISGTVSNGTSNATINLGLGDITPTSVTTKPATDEVSTKVEQSTAVSPTADIFDVTASNGTTKYISTSSAGVTTIAGTIQGAVSGNAGGLSSTLAVGSGGTGTASTPGNGAILIGNGTNYTLTTITGTSDQVIVGNTAGAITLSTPQSIGTDATVNFRAINSGDATHVGSIGLSNGTAASYTTLQSGGSTAPNLTYTFPTTAPAVNQFLQATTVTGTLKWANGATGTVTSVAATGSNGVSIGGSAITTSGTLTIGLGDITPTSVTSQPATDEVSAKVEQSTIGSPTADIFDVTNSGGGSKYISVNNAGVTTIAGTIQGSVSGSATSVPASGLTGATLASGVTASSLQSVGTLSGLTVTGATNINNTAGGSTTNINATAGAGATAIGNTTNAGTITNMSIGATGPSTGKFTTLAGAFAGTSTLTGTGLVTDFTIANTAVTASSSIVITSVKSSTGNYYIPFVASTIAATSFNVHLSAMPASGETIVVSYIIVN